jgi:hypothetical protein
LPFRNTRRRWRGDAVEAVDRHHAKIRHGRNKSGHDDIFHADDESAPNGGAAPAHLVRGSLGRMRPSGSPSRDVFVSDIPPTTETPDSPFFAPLKIELVTIGPTGRRPRRPGRSSGVLSAR